MNINKKSIQWSSIFHNVGNQGCNLRLKGNWLEGLTISCEPSDYTMMTVTGYCYCSYGGCYCRVPSVGGRLAK